jgi:cholesterol transport system auxiliary component
MKASVDSRSASALAAGIAVVLLAGCSALRPAAGPPLALYVLDPATAAPAGAGAASQSKGSGTLVVSEPRAAPGYDSAHIEYTRQDHRLESFAESEWVDTPARMLSPAIVSAIEATQAFGAVVTPAAATLGDVRLGTQILRLQQEFGASPSRVRFTLRATLQDPATHRILAVRVFDLSEPAPEENAYGGVVAANRVVREVLVQLAAFCAQDRGGVR